MGNIMLPYGKERREIIKSWFNTNPTGMYAVNCKHRQQLKNDPDFRKLIKIGFLKVIRQHESRHHGTTFLIKND